MNSGALWRVTILTSSQDNVINYGTQAGVLHSALQNPGYEEQLAPRGISCPRRSSKISKLDGDEANATRLISCGLAGM